MVERQSVRPEPTGLPSFNAQPAEARPAILGSFQTTRKGHKTSHDLLTERGQLGNLRDVDKFVAALQHAAEVCIVRDNLDSEIENLNRDTLYQECILSYRQIEVCVSEEPEGGSHLTHKACIHPSCSSVVYPRDHVLHYRRQLKSFK